MVARSVAERYHPCHRLVNEPADARNRTLMVAPNPLFLREEELDRGLELLFVALRRVEAEAHAIRAEAGIDPTDQWLLLTVERRTGVTLGELAARLGSSKQTLSRHLRRLMALGIVVQGEAGIDRRKRPLRLSEAGAALCRRLAEVQKRRMRIAFKTAGAGAVEGFQTVLGELAAGPRRPRVAVQGPAGR